MPMRSAVTVSLVPEARGGPFVFWDEPPDHFAGACRAAKELGFDGIEIFPSEGCDGSNRTFIRKHLEDNGLALAAVGTGAGWVKHRLTLTSPDADVRSAAEGFIRTIIDFAGSLGAPAIVGSMQGRWGDTVDRESALGLLSESLAFLGEYAKQYGVPVIYEPLNRYETNLANRLGDGVTLLGRVGSRNVKLLADLFHMNIEEANPADAIRSAGPHVGHVHLADSNRRPAGMGHTDFAPIAAALREVGYTGFVSAEAFPYPDPRQAAEATIRAFRQFFA